MQVTVTEVRRVLDNDELVPLFQPVVELHSGKLMGFEVLARMPHPKLGLVLPENFIELAERNGRIGDVLRQMMRKAFASAPLLPTPLTLALNISPFQLQDKKLPAQIAEAAAAANFPTGQLTVEITETALADDLDRVRSVAGELKEMGCKLSLDDFGTGYSSLRHLQALPFDELKVDGSFIRSMTRKRESRKIIAAIVGLGHSLGMWTVAECVENEEQADTLLCLGCEMAQGWFYGRPIPADRISETVAAAAQVLGTHVPATGDSSTISSLEARPAHRLAQLEAIYEGTPIGLCYLDSGFRYVSLNRRLAELDAASVMAHLGQTVQQMLPATYPHIEEYLRRALGGEAILEVESPWPAVKGGNEDRAALLSFQPAFDEAGEVIGISVSVLDITGKKRTEAALIESEDNHRSMVELNPAMPWVMDADGNTVDVSSRWVRLTGLSKERTRNLGWLEALHPDDIRPTMRKLSEALRTGTPIDIEYRVKSVGRTWRWVRSRGSPRYAPSGEIIRWYGSVEDIEECKQMEEMLRQSRRETSEPQTLRIGSTDLPLAQDPLLRLPAPSPARN